MLKKQSKGGFNKKGFGSHPAAASLLIFLAAVVFGFLTLILSRAGLLEPMLVAARDLMTGTFGLVLLIVYLLFGAVSISTGSYRSGIAGFLIAGGVIILRVGISAYLTGEDIIATKIDASLPSIPDGKKPEATAAAKGAEIELVFSNGSKDAVIASEPDAGISTFDYLRSLIENRIAPPPASVRVEDLVNHFNYNYKADPSQPFTVALEAAPSIFNEDKFLLHVGLQARTQDLSSPRPLNLVLIVDYASLQNNPKSMSLFKEGLVLLKAALTKKDHIAIIAAEGGEDCLMPPVNGDSAGAISPFIDSIDTCVVDIQMKGIQTAFAEADMMMKSGEKTTVVLVTESDLNYSIARMKYAENPISEDRYGSLSLIPFASKHRYTAHSGSELARMLKNDIANEPSDIARNISVEVSFNSTYIRKHELVGYYDRAQTKEFTGKDSLDQKVLEAGKSLTFLDEIEMTTSPFSSTAPIDLGLVKVSATIGHDPFPSLYSYSFTSKNIKPSKYEAGTEYRFAVAVAGYGVLLRNSPQKGDLQWNEIKNLAERSLGEDADGSRHQFITLVNTAAELLPQ